MSGAVAAFRHEALFYESEEGFLRATLPFIRGGLERDEPVLVAVSAQKGERLRAELGDAEGATFLDMARVGRNPACIIPVWRDFVGSLEGRCARGIGEPVWPERTADELVECEHHEALLNLAFEGGPPWWLLCPYDVGGLSPGAIDVAHRTHPHVAEGKLSRPSEGYSGEASPFSGSLSEPPPEAVELSFTVGLLPALRDFVSLHARAAGLRGQRVGDFVLAANELATNSIRYGGGRGVIRLWQESADVVCEVADAGRISEPLAGRVRAHPGQTGGRGLWLANHLCELVQIRVGPDGTLVRARMAID